METIPQIAMSEQSIIDGRIEDVFQHPHMISAILDNDSDFSPPPGKGFGSHIKVDVDSFARSLARETRWERKKDGKVSVVIRMWAELRGGRR